MDQVRLEFVDVLIERSSRLLVMEEARRRPDARADVLIPTEGAVVDAGRKQPGVGGFFVERVCRCEAFDDMPAFDEAAPIDEHDPLWPPRRYQKPVTRPILTRDLPLHAALLSGAFKSANSACRRVAESPRPA